MSRDKIKAANQVMTLTLEGLPTPALEGIFWDCHRSLKDATDSAESVRQVRTMAVIGTILMGRFTLGALDEDNPTLIEHRRLLADAIMTTTPHGAMH